MHLWPKPRLQLSNSFCTWNVYPPLNTKHVEKHINCGKACSDSTLHFYHFITSMGTAAPMDKNQIIIKNFPTCPGVLKCYIGQQKYGDCERRSLKFLVTSFLIITSGKPRCCVLFSNFRTWPPISFLHFLWEPKQWFRFTLHLWNYTFNLGTWDLLLVHICIHPSLWYLKLS